MTSVVTFSKEQIDHLCTEVLACHSEETSLLDEQKFQAYLCDLDPKIVEQAKLPKSYKEDGDTPTHYTKVSQYLLSLQRSILEELKNQRESGAAGLPPLAVAQITPAAEIGSGEKSAGSAGYSPLIEEGGVKVDLFAHMPPLPGKRPDLNKYVKDLCPDVAKNLTKSLPLQGGRQLRQDYQRLTVEQVENSLMKPLGKIGKVERIPSREYEQRRSTEVAFATGQKRKAETVGNLEGTLNFLTKMASIEGGDESANVEFRNVATSSFALSQRVAAASLREAREDVMSTKGDK